MATKAHSDARFSTGDSVIALDCAYQLRPVRPRRTFVQGIRGMSNGRGASGLTPGFRYTVESILPNGGLRLEGFTFTVSPAHVVRAR